MSKNRRNRREEKLRTTQRRRSRALEREGIARSVPAVGRRPETGSGTQSDLADDIAALHRLAKNAPGNLDVRIRLVAAYERAGKYASAARVLEEIVALQPDDPGWRLALAEGYRDARAMCAALQELRTAIQRWPDHPLLASTDQLRAQLEVACGEVMANYGLADQPVVAELALHDRQQLCIATGSFSGAVTVGEQLVARLPDFAPGWNNLAEAYFHEDHRHHAERALRRVLQLEPANVFALATQVKHCFLHGQIEEAQQWADQLRACVPTKPVQWTKMAEAAAWLGDDGGVLAAWRGFASAASPSESLSTALTHHLAAVALFRLDREREARQQWQRALDVIPGFEPAHENLQTWKREGREFTPWFFGIRYWFRGAQIESWRREMTQPVGNDADLPSSETSDAFVNAHPELIVLVPALCDRGEPAGRKLALSLALRSRCPELLQGLQSFALGRRGSQAQRIKAVNHLLEAGVLPPGPVRMFANGEWCDVLVHGWEVTDEPTLVANRSKDVQELCEEAYAALRAGNWRSAERLLRAAQARQPDAPDIANNLAVALQGQQRNAEAQALIREVAQRWPEYFFGGTASAQQAIEAGDYDRARETLHRLAQRRRLHVSEMRALAQAFIRLHLALQEPDAAQHWLGLWQNFEPDHPEQAQVESLIRMAQLVSSFQRDSERRRGKPRRRKG